MTQDLNVKVLIPEEKGFPQNLVNSNVDLPERLWIRGNILKNDSRAVAIVGSRHMSDYGARMARRFASELGREGVTIISGMAKGIDGVAHQAAIDAGGGTIAVLGCGVDVIYPKEHKKLYELIIKNGAVVSEFAPGTAPLPKNFLQRNRLVAALSKAVLVVEGRRRSGTLNIANHAANLGIDVFAVPGRVDSPLSDLPNYLIESGAGVARVSSDILEIMG
jgi:DNA processing protein